MAKESEKAEKTAQEKAKDKYLELFDDNSKIQAFDKIAEKYYFANFSSTGKTDFDTLMFSIYIERILEKSQNQMDTYSDYTLSKFLGITQSRISSLKVKKELLYPYKNFNWRTALANISENAIYENGKVYLYVSDRNLYLEIKNAIETSGGYVDVQLNSNLLTVRLNWFLDLMVAISDEKDKKELKKKLREKARETNKNVEFLERNSFGKSLENIAPDIIIEIMGVFVK